MGRRNKVLAFLTFRGVGGPTEFAYVTLGLVLLFPILVWGLWNADADQNPAVVKALAGTVGLVVFFLAYPWLWLVALCRLIRWMFGRKQLPPPETGEGES